MTKHAGSIGFRSMAMDFFFERKMAMDFIELEPGVKSILVGPAG